MMRAILLSSYPSSFLMMSVIPKLKQRNIEIDRIVEPSRVSSIQEVKDIDFILFMHEMAGHSEFYAVKSNTEKFGKPVILLSRKSSLWGDKLPPIVKQTNTNTQTEEDNMRKFIKKETAPVPTSTEIQGQRSLQPEEITQFCSIYMELRDSGKRGIEILPILQEKFPQWKNVPKKCDNLHKFVHRVVNSKIASEEFKNWYLSKKKVPVNKKRDDAEIAKLYAEENEVLKKKLQACYEEISSLKKQMSVMVPSTDLNVEKIRLFFESCNSLNKLGVMNTDMMFEMLWKLLDSKKEI